MKNSTIILVALSVLGVYLTWLSIKATQQNTLAIINDTKAITGPTNQSSQSVDANLGTFTFDHIIAPVTPNLPQPISPTVLSGGIQSINPNYGA